MHTYTYINDIYIHMSICVYMCKYTKCIRAVVSVRRRPQRTWRRRRRSPRHHVPKQDLLESILLPRRAGQHSNAFGN